MDKAHLILPERADNFFDPIIKMVASGTPLREGLNMIVSAQCGALICIGDTEKILTLSNGGFRIDMPFTPQRLFELAKMDGAILLSDDLTQIVRANLHLIPNPGILTMETGMRHRTAARMSAQTDSIVIAVSSRRSQTTLYHSGMGVTIDDDQMLLAKGYQGILALQGLKTILERSSMRLSFLELDDLVTVADVVGLLARYHAMLTIAAETERFIDFLGSNSGLLSNQLEEIMTGTADSFILVIRDYAVTGDVKNARAIARALLELAPKERESARIMSLLGFTRTFVDEDHISPRGFRAISRISMLDEVAVSKIIEEYGSLSAIVSDSKDGFDRLENIDFEKAGVDTARAIAKSFMQLRSVL